MGEYVLKTGRRPTYEYAVISGINDSENEIGALCDFCRGTLAHDSNGNAWISCSGPNVYKRRERCFFKDIAAKGKKGIQYMKNKGVFCVYNARKVNDPVSLNHT